MNKHDFSKCINLRKKLKESIKAKIFISIKDGNLSIIIFDQSTRLTFTYTVHNPNSLHMDADALANVILNEYYMFINNKFFI